MKHHVTGILIGFVVGLVDCALFVVSGEPLTGAMIATALTFWPTIGWAVHMTDIPLPAAAKGILVALFFNVPWIIEYVVSQGHTDLFVVMIGLATVFGALIGLTSQYIRRRQSVPALG